MQEIKLYDPTRVPANWTEFMSATQFAVLHSDVASGAPRTASGDYVVTANQSTCILFETLDAAVSYCVAHQNIPRMRMDIYDHRGKSNEAVRTFVAAEDTKKALNARLYFGLGFLIFGLLLIGFDWITSWEWIWPTAVGIKLMMVSVVFLLWWNFKRN
jgi:hypothetical protein